MEYFTSDCHWNHSNICAGTSKWPNKGENCRNFKTLEEMNNAIVKSINERVGRDDTLYHLGDWSFGGWENIWNFRKQINCEHVIQINGNHDEQIVKNKFFPFLENQDGIIFEIEDKNNWNSPGILSKENEVTAKKLFEEVHDGILELHLKGKMLILCHYPIEEWNEMGHGSIMLHGHVHNGLDSSELNTKYRRMDVGWNGKVYSFDEILQIMNKREIKSHH